MVTGIICKCYYIFGYESRSGFYHPVWNDKTQFLAYGNKQIFGFQHVDCLAKIFRFHGEHIFLIYF